MQARRGFVRPLSRERPPRGARTQPAQARRGEARRQETSPDTTSIYRLVTEESLCACAGLRATWGHPCRGHARLSEGNIAAVRDSGPRGARRGGKGQRRGGVPQQGQVAALWAAGEEHARGGGARARSWRHMTSRGCACVMRWRPGGGVRGARVLRGRGREGKRGVGWISPRGACARGSKGRRVAPSCDASAVVERRIRCRSSGWCGRGWLRRARFLSSCEIFTDLPPTSGPSSDATCERTPSLGLPSSRSDGPELLHGLLRPHMLWKVRGWLAAARGDVASMPRGLLAPHA